MNLLWAFFGFDPIHWILLTLIVIAVVAVLLNRKKKRQQRPDAVRNGRAAYRARRRVGATVASRCPECGSELTADAPEGLCPQCLLKGVISSAHDAARSGPAQATTPYDGPAAPSVETLAPLFPQLEILELIGQGGMGAVYKARQPSLDRLVAVKVLPPEAGRDPAFAERFNREARALARLSHPNIVAVHDVGQASEYYFFVMEYVDGVNLRQVLRDGQLTPEQALRIVPQICDALQYAHEEGIVHRDIKPENILLDRKGRVKIADFGLAKLLGRDTGNFTLTGSRQVMGTLYYMAPEQVERPLEVDHRADIYSLGVVFYEMLTGQLPVGHFPMPSEKAGTDAFLDEVVLHALEREPERRYQHASDVKTDVEAPTRQATRLVPKRETEPTALAQDPFRKPARSIVRFVGGAVRGVGRFFCSLTTWAGLCCLIGLIGCSLTTWAETHVKGTVIGGTRPELTVGDIRLDDISLERTPQGANWNVGGTGIVVGGKTWQGLAGAALFLSLGVLLIATSSLERAPAWRSLLTLGTGLAILVLAASFLSYFDSWKRARDAEIRDEPVGVRDAQSKPPVPVKKDGGIPFAPEIAGPPKVTVTGVATDIRYGPFVALAAASVVVLLGAVQLRGALQRKPREGSPEA
jgi:tRNA A-37 threonylcarbamoyl transferase component Bud32